MASRKKSEGIALLSMYREPRSAEDASMIMDGDRMAAGDSGNDGSPPVDGDENFTPDKGFGSNTPERPQVPLTSLPMQQKSVPLDSLRSRRGTLTIVDYGHDEVAMSPEAEEGEIEGTGCVMFGTGLLSANEGGDATGAVLEEQKDVDPLDKFLPPPQKAKCSEELQSDPVSGKEASSTMATKYKIEKFNGNNFLLWKMRIKVVLRKDNCWAAIGDRPDEILDDDKWKEMDGNAIANLHLALADGVLSSVAEKKTAKEIWDTLTKLYEAKSLHNKIFLKRKFYTLRMMESTSVTDHINTLNTIFSAHNNGA